MQTNRVYIAKSKKVLYYRIIYFHDLFQTAHTTYINKTKKKIRQPKTTATRSDTQNENWLPQMRLYGVVAKWNRFEFQVAANVKQKTCWKSKNTIRMLMYANLLYGLYGNIHFYAFHDKICTFSSFPTYSNMYVFIASSYFSLANFCKNSLRSVGFSKKAWERERGRENAERRYACTSWHLLHSTVCNWCVKLIHATTKHIQTVVTTLNYNVLWMMWTSKRIQTFHFQRTIAGKIILRQMYPLLL